MILRIKSSLIRPFNKNSKIRPVKVMLEILYIIMYITVSTMGFEKKPLSNEMGKIQYIIKNLFIDEIAEYIKNGHVLSANFTEDDSTIIRQTQRCYENFISTSMIMIDLDGEVELELNELIENLKIKPSIAYTTFSHLIENKGNRYRLLYLFENEINDIKLYKDIYKIIVSSFDFKLKDNCGSNVTQAVFGSKKDCILIKSNKIYSISNFIDISLFNKNNITNSNNQISHSNSIYKEEENIIRLERPIQDDEYIEDYWNMSYNDLLTKYRDKYPIFEHTPLYQADDDTPYIILPPEYLEIKRYWLIDYIYSENGSVKTYTTKARKIKDGEGRKKKLFINGILRRMMIPSISFEHLLNCLVYELYHYIDNSKDIIKKQRLFDIAMSAWNADITQYEHLRESDNREFIVNDNYCIKYNVSRSTARNISKKAITYDKIGSLYDCNLTDKQNLEVFKEHGFTTSPKTLQRFRETFGLTRYNKRNNTA